ncbi:protein tyrosine phosphatase [Telmatospirillum siberiense]|uniref:Protein tyrosine phosphatase n=2 Tax=Telmatospirillum siberiense TaxID=382514 RepID=A0A2N3PYT8_9PROT|nr:protein tyrosine phosphatase [Telmatospirillum siberiense]
MWLVDHGFIRDIYCNIHPVTEGVWRSAQPAPRHLRWAKRQGIRTILNLRGRRDTCGAYILEREECERLGLILVDFPIRSRSPMDRETLLAAIDIFDRIEYPVLMHCKSGADRAGLMSTLYLFLKGGVPLREAMRKHLSLMYGHVKQAKTGVLDFVLEQFLADGDESPEAFRRWIATVYDRAKIQVQFHENWLAGVIIKFILRRE